MPNYTVELIKDRAKANGFTDQRYMDAVLHVIDNYEGWDKNPNVANFIQFDKKVKAYTYKQSLEIGQKYLVAVDLGYTEPRWVSREDFEQHNLKKWDSKQNENIRGK